MYPMPLVYLNRRLQYIKTGFTGYIEYPT
jgi:hypothetical protein